MKNDCYILLWFLLRSLRSVAINSCMK